MRREHALLRAHQALGRFRGEAAFGIPTTHLSGITTAGERLWLSDWFAQTVFECKIKDDQLVVHRSYHLPDTRPAGIAWSGDALYVADAWARTLSA